MNKLIYSTFEAKNVNIALLLIRIIVGFEMAFYGLGKLQSFGTNSTSEFWSNDVNFLGLGGSITLGLVIFSELFCSIFVIIGLFNKISLIPLIFTMLYIVVMLDKFEIVYFEENGIGISGSFKFLVFYVLLFLTGPGKYSLDHRFFRI
jgi:putative oxidoreductase